MPAEFEGLFDALLASRLERAGSSRMTDEQRAIATAPDFQARWRAYQAWSARQKPDPEAHARIEAILTRRPSSA
jgi:hypothetical protein